MSANYCAARGSVKKYYFLIRDLFFLRMNLLHLKVGCFYFLQCEIKQIHQIVIFFITLFINLYQGWQ